MKTKDVNFIRHKEDAGKEGKEGKPIRDALRFASLPLPPLARSPEPSPGVCVDSIVGTKASKW
jgi:hypothetical protein